MLAKKSLFPCCLNQFIQEAVLNPVALRKAKIVYNFNLSEYNRVKANRLTDMPFSGLLFSLLGVNS